MSYLFRCRRAVIFALLRSAVATSARRLLSANCEIVDREPRQRERSLVQWDVCPSQSLVPSILLMTRKRLTFASPNTPRSKIGGEGTWVLPGAVNLDPEDGLSTSRLPIFFLFANLLEPGIRGLGVPLVGILMVTPFLGVLEIPAGANSMASARSDSTSGPPTVGMGATSVSNCSSDPMREPLKEGWELHVRSQF